MRILGIDPGVATIGFGLVEAQRAQVHMVTYGAITTPAGLPLSRRLYQIDRDMEELIQSFQPDEMSIEELFFSKNITTGIAVAQARGAALAAVAARTDNVYEYTPMQIKQAITGYGGADKIQMQRMVKALLGMQEIARPDDAADALAVALTHANSMNMKKLFKIQ